MLKTFYVQLEKDTNKITDVIEYAYEDYIEVQLETPLPNNILASTYKLVNGSAVYVQEWDKNELLLKLEVLQKENEQLKNDTAILQDAVNEILSNTKGV